MSYTRWLVVWLLAPLVLVLLPVLLPPLIIHLTTSFSRASAYMEHLVGEDLSATSWEYIVVGAGSAGCVVAARLAETRATVLLVEEDV